MESKHDHLPVIFYGQYSNARKLPEMQWLADPTQNYFINLIGKMRNCSYVLKLHFSRSNVK